MNLKVIGSSSSGNSYILENQSEALIIELGVAFDKVLKALDYNTQKVKCGLISHSHADHCKYVHKALAHGIDILASKGTLMELGISNHYRTMRMKPTAKYDAGGFTIKPFKINHDTAEPFGFLIHHKECGNVVFITDTYYVDYTFAGLNQIIIEANYDENIIADALIEGRTQAFIRNRVIGSHMSLQTCKEFLQANDLSQVNNVVLIHLSDSHSDAAMFKLEIETLTGKTVSVADKGMAIEFNINPF